MRLPLFASWPIRRKILVPFAVLSLLYAVLGTYIFSGASAREERARDAARLRDAAAVLSSAITESESRLAEAVRRIVFTEGVVEAVASRNRPRLRRLVLPLAGSLQSSVLSIVDAGGKSLLEVTVRGTGSLEESAASDWSGVPIVAAALEARSRARDLHAGIVERRDTLVAVSAPVRRGEASVGAVFVGESLVALLDQQEGLTRAALAMLGPEGRRVAGAEIGGARPAGETAAQVPGRLGGREASVLLIPVTVGGARAGTLVVAFPSVSGLDALGGEAVKILFLALGALVGVFLIGSGIVRWISRPILSLVRATRALRAGDLSHRAPVEPGDEIGELALSFNEMADELEESHRDLEQRVDQRTRELADALVELERANSAKSLFLASVSHELRNPLSGILLASEMVQDPGAFKLSEKRVRELGTKIHNGGRYLLALIDDLLDLGRIESGNLEIRPEPIALGPLVQEVREAIAPVAAQKGVSVEMPATADHRLHADPVRLRQVLFNLLTNAVKFTDRGGKVRVRVSGSKEEVRIAVRDTGIGIARSDFERIFEPFEQVSRTRAQGTGLGLAIAKRIIEMQGGSISLSSAPGKGSTFTVALPRIAAPAGNGETGVGADAAGEEAASPAGRVLVVEDDVVARELVASTLRSAGHEVVTASTVAESLARVGDTSPNLVLLDVRLGDEDGLEIVRTLRAEGRSVPVVAMSAHGFPADVDRGLAAGCDAYLVKPVGTRTLLRSVRNALEAGAAAPSPNGGAVRKKARRR